VSRLSVAWWIAGLAAGAYEAALKYTLQRKQFGRPIAKFQLIQERLSRMCAHCEFINAMLVHLSARVQAGKAEIGEIARAKAAASLRAREVVALARETCGGNGILLKYHVIKQFMDIETMYTGEGTYDINSLVSGREITGGLSAFK
jgi:glutaryl-CoA dehydrogenase